MILGSLSYYQYLIARYPWNPLATMDYWYLSIEIRVCAEAFQKLGDATRQAMISLAEFVSAYEKTQTKS